MRNPKAVTNRIALALAAILALLIGIDLAAGLGASLFLARRFIVLLDWLAFWR